VGRSVIKLPFSTLFPSHTTCKSCSSCDFFILHGWNKQATYRCFRATCTVAASGENCCSAAFRCAPRESPGLSPSRPTPALIRNSDDEDRKSTPAKLGGNCSHPRQLLGAKSLKLGPQFGEALPRDVSRAYLPQEAGPRTAGGKQPCVVTPCCNTLQPWPVCSSTSGSQHHACPARGHERCSTFHPRTEPRLQKSSLPERYASLLPAEKIPPGILQGAHAAARNSHGSTWLEHWRPALGSHATAAASSASLGGEPGTLPGSTSTPHPAVHLQSSAGCCTRSGALPRGSLRAVGSMAGCWLRLRSLVHAVKPHPARLARMWFCPRGGHT